MKRILMVEDEEKTRTLLNIHLRRMYHLTLVEDGIQALKIIDEQYFDLILLDVTLPYIDGWTVCEKVRKRFATPIILLSEYTELADLLKGFKLGADDYIKKPFELLELQARIKALLHRTGLTPREQDTNRVITYDHGTFVLDFNRRTVSINQQEIALTAKEFEVLGLLAASPERVFTREELIDHIWADKDFRDVRSVDSQIKNIRLKFKKTDPDIQIIKTVWGLGYQFILPKPKK
ncbi:response regulator transcription factor [Rummeliibacillus suwonensis]|uniref:response regulator transcription factor n=1 Tax=Rummeliibacillus suwonensis TaxID=1306154 RepID=UPI0011B51DAC|nr:response regulator transcription factor [Rummeliibacillus suwonensis]MBO2535815.1 response regulator transcription factor [Rummeliibacillus suwonensis]